MNLILFHSKQRLNGTSRVQLSKAQSLHVRSVLKAKLGQALKVGEEDGLCGEGVVVRNEGDLVDLEVSLNDPPPKPVPVVVAVALPRPKAFRRLLQTVVTLGAKRIVFFHAARVEKSYWESEFLSPEKVREQLVLGLEQCGDTVMPSVQFEKRFRPFFEDRMPDLLVGRTGWLAQPGMTATDLGGGGSPGVLVVGPEGGFVPFETEFISGLGFKTISLGSRVLKTEAAVTALVSRLYF